RLHHRRSLLRRADPRSGPRLPRRPPEVAHPPPGLGGQPHRGTALREGIGGLPRGRGPRSRSPPGGPRAVPDRTGLRCLSPVAHGRVRDTFHVLSEDRPNRATETYQQEPRAPDVGGRCFSVLVVSRRFRWRLLAAENHGVGGSTPSLATRSL